MTTKPTAPRHAAVIGGGTMGVGITHVLLDAGVPVTLTETDTARLQAARRAVQASLAASAARGKLSTSPAAAEAQLTTSVRVSDLADPELVVEAVPESITLKHEVLSRAEAVVADTAVLATNTSSLSIDQLAKPLRRPARFLGMHFFNPVPASALVEVVRGSATSDAALRTAHAVAALVDKESIEVTDAPGFATSRLGILLGLEAIRVVEDGVASAADIDKAMVWDTGTRWAHSGSPTSSDSTFDWVLPSTCTPSSATDSPRPGCCGRWSPPAGSARRPDRASTRGIDRAPAAAGDRADSWP